MLSLIHHYSGYFSTVQGVKLMKYYILILTAVFFSPNLYANMILSQNIIHFDSGALSYKTIQVKNVGKDTLYINSFPTQVTQPGSEKEKRLTIKNPRQLGLLISPKRFKLLPGQSQFVQISSVKREQDEDLVYRVKFSPTVADITANRSGLKILIAYELLVLVQPATTNADLLYEQRGEMLWLENKGNTNILLASGTHCLDDDQCIDLPSKRLYAGQNMQIPLKTNALVDYRIKIGSKNKNISLSAK